VRIIHRRAVCHSNIVSCLGMLVVLWSGNWSTVSEGRGLELGNNLGYTVERVAQEVAGKVG
jgi:hypothetical protein